MRLAHKRLCGAHRVYRSIIVYVFCMGLSAMVQAAEINGVVLDAISGGPAAGAEVKIQNRDSAVTTDERGRFALTELPQGEFSLTVEYKDYDIVERQVQLDSESVAVTLFAPNVRNLEELSVQGKRIEGQYVSKRSAANFIDAIGSSQIRSLPDQDISDVLIRTPGVNVPSVDQSISGNDPTGIEATANIRGLPGDFNNVTVNGHSVSSTAGTRAVPLDVLPADMAEEVQVTKSLIPSQDANSIGGTVNIKTISAFDRTEPYLSFRASAGGFSEDAQSVERQNSDEIPRKLSLVYATQFGADKQFGLAFNVSHKYTEFGSGLASNGGDWEQAEGVWLPDRFTATRADTTRERFSFGGSLEWRPTSGSRYILDGFYTREDEYQALTINQFLFAENAEDVVPNPTEPGTPGDFLSVADDTESEREADFFEQEKETSFVTFETSHRFSAWTLDTSLHYTRAERDLNTAEWSFDGPRLQVFIEDDQKFVTAFPEDPALFDDPANYTFDEIDREPLLAEDQTASASLDIRRDMTFWNQVAGYIKFGLSARTREYRQNQTEQQFCVPNPNPDNLCRRDLTNPFNVSLSDFGLFEIPEPIAGLPVGPSPDRVTARVFDASNPDFLQFIAGSSTLASLTDDFAVEEDVYAGYAMFNADYKQWTFTGGIRVEATDTTSDVTVVLTEAPFLLQDESNIDQVRRVESRGNEYIDVFPSLTARYRYNENFTLRAAISSSIARPRLTELAASQAVELARDRRIELPDGTLGFQSGVLVRGNPELDPRTSINFDLGGEWYFNDGGLAAASIFYKTIDDPIFASSVIENDVTIQGEFVQELNILTTDNASDGQVYGIELQYDKKADMLPAPFNGFGVMTSLTLSESELDLPSRPDSPAFQGQADVLANLVPYYENGQTTVRLAARYVDEFNQSFGGDRQLDSFRDERITLDLHLSYQFQENASAFFQVSNLTEEPLEDFRVGPGRITSQETVPRVWWAGINLDF